MTLKNLYEYSKYAVAVKKEGIIVGDLPQKIS